MQVECEKYVQKVSVTLCYTLCYIIIIIYLYLYLYIIYYIFVVLSLSVTPQTIGCIII